MKSQKVDDPCRDGFPRLLLFCTLTAPVEEIALGKVDCWTCEDGSILWGLCTWALSM
jgi:hypothetical protein